MIRRIRRRRMIRMRWIAVALAVSLLAILIAGCGIDSSDEAPEDGAMAPDFTVQTLDGESVTLSDLRGNPVFLNFWTTWCGPCVAELPDIQEVHEEKSVEGLVVLAVNLGERESTVEAFIESNDYSFEVGLDENGAVAQAYEVVSIPATFLIDSEGIIQSEKVGMFTSKAEIIAELQKIMP